MEEHKKLFLEKAKEIGFAVIVGDVGAVVIQPESQFYMPNSEGKVLEWLDTDKGSSEAARYCLVNGHIPFTKENVALVGGDSWFIGGDKIPKELHKKFIDIALESREDWEVDDDLEEETLKVLEQTLDGIHIQNGRLIDVKVAQLSEARVYRTFYTPDINKEIFPLEVLEISTFKEFLEKV